MDGLHGKLDSTHHGKPSFNCDGPSRHGLCRRPSFNFGVATILKLIAISAFPNTYPEVGEQCNDAA